MINCTLTGRLLRAGEKIKLLAQIEQQPFKLFLNRLALSVLNCFSAISVPIRIHVKLIATEINFEYDLQELDQF